MATFVPTAPATSSSSTGSTVSWSNLAATSTTENTTDPGAGAAIPVTQNASFSLTVGAGAEANTLADPTFLGQVLTITAATVGGGSRTITADNDIDQAGSTMMTFAAVADSIGLIAVQIGSSLAWRVLYNDGVALL